MTKIISPVLTIILAICINHISNGEATVSFNAPKSGSEYGGWDETTSQSYDIMHQSNYPIKFHTQGTALGATASPWDNLRMIISEGPLNAASPYAGFVGIGYASPPRHLIITTRGTGVTTQFHG